MSDNVEQLQQKLPVVVTIDQGPADARKTLPLRSFVSAPQAVLPVPIVGPWKRLVSLQYYLSEGAKEMRIDIEAESYRWSTTRHVYSSSVNWSYMSRSMQTEKTLSITREQLRTQDVIVYGLWFGTPPNHDDPINDEEIRGKLMVIEIFDDGEYPIESKTFAICGNSDNDDDERIVVFGNRAMPVRRGLMAY